MVDKQNKKNFMTEWLIFERVKSGSINVGPVLTSAYSYHRKSNEITTLPADVDPFFLCISQKT